MTDEPAGVPTEPPPVSPGPPPPGLGRQLVIEAGRKSDLAWIGPMGRRQQGVWCEWHDDTLLVLTGGIGSAGIEQPNPGLVDGTPADVTLRSKDKGVRVVTFRARAELLEPRSAAWEAAADVLKAGRLNTLDSATVLQRWADECGIWQLTPTDQILEQPGSMSGASHRAVPAATPATTAGSAPLMIGKLPPRRTGRHL